MRTPSNNYILILFLILGSLFVFFIHSGTDRPPIFLITVDTLRSDHMPIYGHTRNTTPFLSTISSDFIVFENAFVPVSKTGPSLVSILTGLHPRSHRVFENGKKVDPGITFVSEVLDEEDYITAGVCGQFNCDRRFGFAQGFSLYEDRFQVRPDGAPYFIEGRFQPFSEKRAEEVIDESLRLLRRIGRKNNPVFLWMHLMDPHAAYDPPPELSIPYEGSSKFSSNSIFGQKIPDDYVFYQAKREGTNDYDYYLNKYDDEIRYMDMELGRFFRYLKEQGLYEKSLIIIASDHGEYMGEKEIPVAYFQHGRTISDAEIKVPLLMKLPKNRYGGTGISSPVSVMDIFPTIMDFLNLRGHQSEGISLLKVISRPWVADPERLMYAFSFHEQLIGIRKGNRKLQLKHEDTLPIFFQRIKKGEKVNVVASLFNLDKDPLERHDIAKSNESLVNNLVQNLFDWIRAPSGLANDIQDPQDVRDKDAMEHLKSLGYAG